MEMVTNTTTNLLLPRWAHTHTEGHNHMLHHIICVVWPKLLYKFSFVDIASVLSKAIQQLICKFVFALIIIALLYVCIYSTVDIWNLNDIGSLDLSLIFQRSQRFWIQHFNNGWNTLKRRSSLCILGRGLERSTLFLFISIDFTAWVNNNNSVHINTEHKTLHKI
jgi:hypothetical protein